LIERVYLRVYFHVNKILTTRCVLRKAEETRGKKRLKKNFIAKVVTGHRITIPREICQILQIEKGDFVDVDITKIHLNPPIKSEAKGRNRS